LANRNERFSIILTTTKGCGDNFAADRRERKPSNIIYIFSGTLSYKGFDCSLLKK
jgi:hypothetical protein